MVLHDGAIAEMQTGEGKTLTAHARRGAQRARRRGRPRRHGQRLPRPPRRRVDAPDLRRPRPDRRRAAEHAALRGEARRLRGRHHVRHELRVRLRLPARQHGDHRWRRRSSTAAASTEDGKPLAIAPLRDRRRGRQHPHRRGAHAADHLRRARAGRRPLRPLRQARAAADARQEARGHGPEDARRSSSPTTTTSSTRSTRRSRSPSAASPRPSSSSASTTSTRPRTARWSTT